MPTIPYIDPEYQGDCQWDYTGPSGEPEPNYDHESSNEESAQRHELEEPSLGHTTVEIQDVFIAYNEDEEQGRPPGDPPYQYHQEDFVGEEENDGMEEDDMTEKVGGEGETMEHPLPPHPPKPSGG